MLETNPLFTAMEALRDATIKGLMIGLPGKVLSYDHKTQRAQIEPGIQRSLGDGKHLTLSVIDGVPVHFPGTAQWSLFHELLVGTEGYIHFSQRSVDAWVDQGGPVAPTDNRMFSATDAFFVPGFRSMQTVIPSLPTSGVGFSSRSGDVRVHCDNGNIALNVGGASIKITASGITLVVGGSELNLTSGGLTHNGANIGSTHRHGGVKSGGSQTSEPQ